MRPVMARVAVACATLCIHQAATAQDALHFWPAGGEHGLDACAFVTLPTGDEFKRIGRLTFGVYAEPQKLELTGKVRLREDGARRLDIGAGPQTLLSVKLETKDAGTAMGSVPGAEMAEVLHALVRYARVWMRVGDAAGRPVEEVTVPVVGKEKDVAWCLAILERDLAEQRLSDPAGIKN